MGYAEVCVNSPAAGRQTFSYSIPSHLNVAAGHAVLVPFGEKTLQGIVLRLTAEPAVEQTRDISDIIDPIPLLSPEHIELARWISDYYLSPLFDSVALMLPPGFERKVLTFVSTSLPEGFDITGLPDEHRQIIDEAAEQGKPVNVSRLGRSMGKKKARQIISQLIKKQFLSRSYALEPVKVKVKTERNFALKISPERAREEAQKLRVKAGRQADLLDFLADLQRPASSEIIKRKIGFSKSVAAALIKKGLIKLSLENMRRDPLAHLHANLSWPLPLTPSQLAAFTEIKRSLIPSGSSEVTGRVFLLHGITGSGKTEVYLQSLAEVVNRGKKGIVLVPEIALTPQTLDRFTARFPGKVAVLHSRLTLGEQFDEWSRIRNGEAAVVIGPRSALFAPQQDLGLLVIDEEHEWSYKQTEQPPYYHTRTAAIKLAALTGAAVILGSATPDVETYYLAQKGDYKLLQLPDRLVSGADSKSHGPPVVEPGSAGALPVIDVVDMREELKTGNRSLFSKMLHQAVVKSLASGGQVILFLNRRGASTFLQCRRCGFSFRCRRCDVPMTYHEFNETLMCHQCSYHVPKPGFCPDCRSPQIKYLGQGTEKLEQETTLLFPGAGVLRWDSDTAHGWQSHREILEKFRRREADILIGTQMISKGIDIPGVTLVGIINADTGLNLPDFRAGERTFQLLCQVAGRAGRGPMGGRVVIQTYSPGHYAIRAAAAQDYGMFFRQELDFRRQLRQPPFTRLAGMVYSHRNDDACRREAERMRDYIEGIKLVGGISDIDIIGPAPAFIRRRRGHYRWRLVIRGFDPAVFLAVADMPAGWQVNIDPLGLS